MNTRSKSVSNPSKPYKTNNNRLSLTNDSTMAEKNSNIPNDTGKNFAEMSVDEKLNMLLTSVAKLETVPKDIEGIQASILVIQSELKSIPVLKEKIKTIEDDLREQKTSIDSGKKTTAALEVSVTNTQKDVDEFRLKLKEMQDQMDQNKTRINDFESKIRQDEKKIDELTKNALKEEIENSKVAKMIQIQGIPEDRHENLFKIAQQIIFDTGVKVHPIEIDEVYREGKYSTNPTLKAKLLATGNKKLVESTMNNYWGCGLTIPQIDKMVSQQGAVKYHGKNWLGSQTEDVRRDLLV